MRFVQFVMSLGSALLLTGGLCHCSSDGGSKPGSNGSNTDGGGSTSVDIASLIPADGAMDGWAGNPAGKLTHGQVVSGHSEKEAVDAIDGSAAPFFTASYKAVGYALKEFAKGDEEIDIRVWQMASEADCKQLWGDITSVSLYQGNWQDVTLGDQGRAYADAGGWFLNSRKKAHFVTVTYMGDGTAAGLELTKQFAAIAVDKVP